MAAVSITAEPIVLTDSLLAGIPAGIFAEPIEVYDYLGATLTPYVYVVDSGNNRIQAFDYDGIWKFNIGPTITGLTGDLSNPYGITSDGTYLYFTDSGNNRIVKTDLLGVYVYDWGTFGSGRSEFDDPKGITASSRYLWVVDSNNSRFQVFTFDGGYIWQRNTAPDNTPLDHPTDAEIAGGYLAILDEGNSRWVYYPLTIPEDISIVVVMPVPAMTISVSQRSITINCPAPFPQPSLTVVETPVISINAPFPMPRITVGVQAQSVISITAPVPMPEDITLTIQTPAVISITVEMPIPAISLSVSGGLSGVSVVVINTTNGAITEYDNFDIDSMCYFQGKYIGIDSTGLCLLEGNKDGSTDIDAELQTSTIDLHKDVVRRARDIYVNYRSDGKLELSVVSDETDERAYILSEVHIALEEYRQKLPRGVKDRFESYIIRNINGADFDLDKFRVLTEKITHRVR